MLFAASGQAGLQLSCHLYVVAVTTRSQGVRSQGTDLVLTCATAVLAGFPACNALNLSLDLMVHGSCAHLAACMRHLSIHAACNGTPTARQSASQPWFLLCVKSPGCMDPRPLMSACLSLAFRNYTTVYSWPPKPFPVFSLASVYATAYTFSHL